MDLRKTKTKSEYRELQSTLRSLGIYEEGMQLLEMRQVWAALQRSASESDSDNLDGDMQRALRESESDFALNQSDRILNSTMMSANNNPNPSTSNNPDMKPGTLLVEAQVHHPLDWTPSANIDGDIPSCSTEDWLAPPGQLLFSESCKMDISNSSGELESSNELSEAGAKSTHKRSSNDITTDLNITGSVLDESFCNSLPFIDGSENSPETPNSNPLEVPVSPSGARVQDSGLLEGYRSPYSSYDNSSVNLSSYYPASSSRQSSVEGLNDDSHEIHGPISVRPVVDSGVNLSTEMPRSSFEDNANENSSSSVDNSRNPN